jgi:hypothetical protein
MIVLSVEQVAKELLFLQSTSSMGAAEEQGDGELQEKSTGI